MSTRLTDRTLTRYAFLRSVACLAIACTAGVPTVRAQSIRRSQAARVDSIFAMYDATTTPGCGVAVLHADSVIFRKAYGMAHIGFGVPMTTTTTVWIPYSEARVFTAIAVAMLARDGAIALDDAVRRHVPEVPSYAGAVTVRQLLHHASGLADYGVLLPGFDTGDRLTEDEMFRSLERWGKLGFSPGRGQMYSNTDYALLRILVERVSRRSLHDYLHDKVLGPLGMRDTQIGADQGMATSAHALFHEPVVDSWRSVLRYRVSPVGGISVTTSTDDLARWARGLRDPAYGIGALLDSLERGAPDSAQTEGTAFGVHRVQEDGRRLVKYRGVGDYVYLTRDDASDLSVVVTCNAYRGMDRFGPAVASLFAGHADSLRRNTASAPPMPPAPTVAIPVAELQRYVAEYVRLDGGDIGVRVVLRDGVLAVTLPSGRSLPLRPLGDGRFSQLVDGVGEVRVVFSPSDSTPGGLLLTSQMVATGEPAGPPLRKKSALRPPATALLAFVGTYVGDAAEATLHVTVHGDRAMIATRGLAATELQPQQEADTFRFDIYVVRFGRDPSGGVTHLTLDASRVKGSRYTRSAAR